MKTSLKAHTCYNSIGTSNYNILSALIALKAPTELEYELIKDLKIHLVPMKKPIFINLSETG